MIELDERILNGKKPLTYFDFEQAKEFVGKECYFSNYLDKFCTLDDAINYINSEMIISKDKHIFKGELLKVDDSELCSEARFEAGIRGDAEWFQFCLPCELVNEAPKKKFRPLTSEEFLALYDSGKLHSIRQADAKGRYIITDIYFSDSCGKEEVYVCFDCGDCGYEMEYLLENNFEYLDGDEWKPFGIEIHK